jgi:hypothetical protein
VRLAFERDTVTLPLERILPTKALPASVRRGGTYKIVEASLDVVGMVEPLVVFRQPDDTYILLEGHSRLEALVASGAKSAECLVSTDDEKLTFKREVSHIAPIQANKMIVRALDAGVPEERLAKALNRPVATIRTSRTMLKDICDEALELLKDKPIKDAALRLFKLVKPLRQIEMAEMMNKMANYGKAYAAAIVSRTKEDQLNGWPDSVRALRFASLPSCARPRAPPGDPRAKPRWRSARIAPNGQRGARAGRCRVQPTRRSSRRGR